VEANANAQLERLFYMSKDMIYRAAAFGQVLVIDTTAKTNRFDMYLFLASVMDNRSKSSIVCICFMRTETAMDFGWIFQQMRQAMVSITCDIDQIIQVVVSDEDKAMMLAIKMHMPNAKQMLCRWHVGQNIHLNCGTLLSNTEIRIQYERIVEEITDEEQWNTEWNKLLSMIESEIGPSVNYFKEQIYGKRKQICKLWVDQYMNMGIYTTQRAESQHAVRISITLSFHSHVRHNLI